MLTSEFDYYLPKELIAQIPLEKRDLSRLLVLHRDTGNIEHRYFPDLIEYLQPEDILVVNDSKVFPARLWAIDTNTGKPVELLLIRPVERKGFDKSNPYQVKTTVWEALTRPAKRCQPGVTLLIQRGRGEVASPPIGQGNPAPAVDNMQIHAKIISKLGGSRGEIEFSYTGNWNQLLSELGEMPVPPYIKRGRGAVPAPEFESLKQIDKHRYQTVYAKHDGSIAAPTAGLHFTEELLQQIKEKGNKIASVTLHVGPGTFQPVRTERVPDHKLEPEYYLVSQETADAINATKKHRSRIVAVGTTSTRTLETVAKNNGLVHPGEGWSDLFVYPEYKFKIVDALLTNFHLPQSTLLMLVAAFVGREKILEVYQEAINRKYRFYSYGDAMLIL